MRTKRLLLRELWWLGGGAQRLVNSLWLAGVRTLDDLVALDPEEFAKLSSVRGWEVSLLLRTQRRLTGTSCHGSLELPEHVRAVPHGPAQVGASDTRLFRSLLMWRQHPDAIRDGAYAATFGIDGELLCTDWHCRELPLWLYRRGLTTVGDVLSVDVPTISRRRSADHRTVADLPRLQAEIQALVHEHEADVGAGAWDGSDAGFSANEEPTADDHPPLGSTRSPRSELRSPVPDSLAGLLREALISARAGGAGDQQERNTDIVLAYWGFGRQQHLTLNEVGREFGVTRERIRQICAKTLKGIPLHPGDHWFAALLRALERVFYRCLGVAPCEDFCELLARQMGWKAAPRPHEIASLARLASPSLDVFDVSDDTGCVRHRHACDGLWQSALRATRRRLEEIDRDEHILDLTHWLSEELSADCWGDARRPQHTVPCCGAKHGVVRLPQEYVRAVLMSISLPVLDGDRVVSLDRARLRHSRTTVEVVGAALRVLGRTAHYRELAEFIQRHSDSGREFTDRVVHACLCTHSEFVLTQRLGTYGLAEWGLERYATAADMVEEYLRDRGRPMPQNQIVQALARRGVPENNCRASFCQSRFSRTAEGHIGLSEWDDGGEDDPTTKLEPKEILFTPKDERPKLIIGQRSEGCDG